MLKYSLLFISILMSCSGTYESTNENTDDTIPMAGLYFPPLSTTEWETISISELGWNVTALTDLNMFLTETNTEAFIILKDGKIVIEKYYNGATGEDLQPWNSAGKTLTAFTAGIALKEGLLDLQDSATEYLGEGWTEMTPQQENNITLYHQLTMTSGGDYGIDNTACYDPNCLQYLNEPGSFWYYHNAFYTLLQPVMDVAVPTDFRAYFTEKLRDKIGMNGGWVSLGYNNVYFSTARSMARFGLLNLNEGSWEEQELISISYFEMMTNTSQALNKSYGYLWWLNGKESHRIPQLNFEISGALIPNAPNDLIAGLGKDDQKLYVIPSENLVIVRMGVAGGSSLPGPTGYDNELWDKINAVIN